MNKRDEYELIDAAKAGDRAALAGLVERYQDAVYRFGRAMCGSPEDAKDVLQDTLITALQKVGDFRGEASFRTWLYAIARSQCSRKRRKGSRELLATEEQYGIRELPDPAPLAVEALESVAERSLVAEAIAQLSPMYREVLILRDMEGLTAPEVAETLGLTVEAVKSRLHRARAKVRDLLSQSRASEAQRADGCPDVVEMLSRSLEGELRGIDCDAMQAHVDQCPACKMECDSLKRILSLCSTAGAEEAPTEVKIAMQVVLARLRTES